MHGKHLSVAKKQVKLHQSLTFSDLSFMQKFNFFSLTHDLSHEILYAFGSVIKLICHFSIIFCWGERKRKKQNEDPAKRHLSCWWIIRVTSSLFKWNLKGLVKMITTIFHGTSSGRNIFFWSLISFCFCHLERNEPWMANANRRLWLYGNFLVNFSHSWLLSICFGQVKLITEL